MEKHDMLFSNVKNKDLKKNSYLFLLNKQNKLSDLLLYI